MFFSPLNFSNVFDLFGELTFTFSMLIFFVLALGSLRNKHMGSYFMSNIAINNLKKWSKYAVYFHFGSCDGGNLAYKREIIMKNIIMVE